MAAKLLHSLTDDNQELQKQIGCMTGVFQLFDRHQVLAGAGRRIVNPAPKRPSSDASSYYSSRLPETEFNDRHRNPILVEKQLNKNSVDKQRASTESSRASFSSSSRSSSFSSQPDPPSFDQSMSIQPNASPQYGRHSLDLRDVVKDSMYRESRALSVKTAPKDSSERYRDSPRPPQLPKELAKIPIKPKESPWYLDEPRQLSRSASQNPRTATSFMVQKEAPRFSYDGRELNKLAFKEFKELPRLSLDSRDSSLRSFNSDSKSEMESEVPILQKTPTRPPNVVAKLMGLETFPSDENKTHFKIPEDSEHFLGPLKTTGLVSNSSKNLWKEPTSPRWRNNDPSVKPVSRFPIEPAPWRQIDGTRSGGVSQKPAVSKILKAPAKPASPFPSVYCEIEKRLSNLEFTQSGKDLRALKQILEAMQVKGLLETRKEVEDSNFASPKEHDRKSASSIQHGRPSNQKKQQGDNLLSSTNRGTGSSRIVESSIVIMKPAKLVEKTVIHSVRDQILPKTGRRDNTNNSSITRTSTRNIKTSHNLPKESTNTMMSAKSSGSTSPRLTQKKAELEKRSRPPTPPSDSSSRSRKPANKQQTESTSPGGRRRPKSSNFQQSEDQSTEISNSVCITQQSDTEVTSLDRTAVINGCQSPLPEKKSTLILSESESLMDLTTIAPEYPSPVSVLDNVAYSDNSPSPLKQITETLKDAGTRNSNGYNEQWNFSSEINHQKLQNIDNLVQKLRRLNSGHDEARTDYIASLCENTNPDHRYISEILLASGLLLRDLGSSLTTFQFHQSGHPINPELFLVLEQTKASSKPKEYLFTEKEKSHRKLIFDAANEILAGKLSCVGPGADPWIGNGKITKKTLNAQKLLRELCMEIDSFMAKGREFGMENEDNEDDGLKGILWEDVMCCEHNWKDFKREISSVVLDVERSIFKDLVGEIVMGEAAVRLKVNKQQGRRRQLFVK